MSTGVRLALEPGQGRTAVPVRSTITGAAVAVVSLVTAVVFSASLNHLLATPRLFGAPWDARVENVGDGGVADPMSALTADPRGARQETDFLVVSDRRRAQTRTAGNLASAYGIAVTGTRMSWYQ